MKKSKIWFKGNKITMLAAIVVGLAWVFLHSVAAAAEPGAALFQNQVIRLHIPAHDDSVEEQVLKFAVRDGIWEFLADITAQARNAAEAREIIIENLPAIEELARQILLDNNSGHRVSAKFWENLPFPTTNYAGLIFPQGRYEALEIIIGDGAGENWWCVVFPPLCFMRISRGEAVGDGEGVTVRPGFWLLGRN